MNFKILSLQKFCRCSLNCQYAIAINDYYFRVNAVSASCERSIDEVKKRWKDAKASVKKKEALRKRLCSQTGGGPTPAVSFKGWETEVLNLIPPESICGIEGAADTGYIQAPEGTEVLPSGDNSLVLGEPVPIEYEEPASKQNIPSKKKEKDESSNLNEFLLIESKKLELTERQTIAQERIAASLEKLTEMFEKQDGVSVTPFIKFD